MDLSSMSDSDLQSIAGQGGLAAISQGILGQESGNNPNIGSSIDGAIGQAQIMPSTFAQYARPREDINNPADNLAVYGRILQDLSQKAGGDPARIAVGYFSGPGNIAPPNSPTPWKHDRSDGNGKSVSSYVSDVLGRVGQAVIPSAQAAEMPQPDLSHISDEQLVAIAQPDPAGLGSQPWAALHIQSQPLPDIQKNAPISQGKDALNTLTGNVLPNIPLSAFGAISAPLEFLHRGADYLGEHAANVVRSAVGLPPSQAQYEPFVATPGQMTSDIADWIGHPLYQPQTALGRLTGNIGGNAIPTAMTGGLSALAALATGSGTSEIAKQLGGGDEAQYWSGLAGGAAGGKLASMRGGAATEQSSALSQVAKPLETNVSNIDPNTPLMQYANLGLRAGSDETLSSPEISAQVAQLQAVTQNIAQLEKVGSTDPAGRAQLADLNKQADALRTQLGMTGSPPSSPMTVKSYVDDYMSGAGRNSLEHEQFAANNASAIEKEFQARKSASESVQHVTPTPEAAAGNAPAAVPTTASVPQSPPVMGTTGAPKTSAEMQILTNGAYAKANASGAVLKPNVVDNFINQAEKLAPQTVAGKIALGDTPTTQLIARLQGLRGKPLSLAEVQELDEGIGNLVPTDLGRPTKEGVNLLKIQDALRNTVADAGENDIIGGSQGFNDLVQARKYAQQMYKMRDIERILNRGNGKDNPGLVIRNGLATLHAKLLENPKGWSPQEIAAVKTGSSLGPTAALARVFGSRLIPIGSTVMGEATGGMAGAAIAGSIAHVASGAARKIVNNAARSRANNVLSTIAKNTTPKVRK